MIARLLLALLLTPAFAANKKADVPQIPQLSVPAAPVAHNLGALPAIPRTSIAPQASVALPPAAIVPAAAAPAAAAAAKTDVALAAQAAHGATPAERAVATRVLELENAFKAPESISETTIDLEAGRQYAPSPEDWRDEVLYSIMVDRFAKSERARPVGDPKDGLSRHGGDLKGITAKLDYIKASGVTTLLLSPLTQTVPEAYHGYAPTHFMAVDPHLGTMDDLKELTREAHKRGMKVVLDLVINHAGPVFEYEGGPSGSGWVPMSQGKKGIGYWTQQLLPRELTNPDRFTRHGVISNWNDHEQSQYGDFPPNYRHFSTDDPATQEQLIYIAKWWIKEADLDGYRLDAIKHVDQGFVRRFGREIREFAKTLGKDKFLILGENSSGMDSDMLASLGTGIDTVYNYPEYRRVNYALHGKAPASQLGESVQKSIAALGEFARKLVRFIDLHDTYRFLRGGEHADVLKVGMAFLLFSIGIPLVYYGTEQAFRTSHGRLDPEDGTLPADPENRADMFDSFDESNPAFKDLARFAELRKKHAALRRGEHYVRWADPNGAGVYAFSRILGGDEVVVVTNTSDDARTAVMWVDANLSAPGTKFVDELDPSFSADAFKPSEGGAQIAVSVPPRGVRVLVKKAA